MRFTLPNASGCQNHLGSEKGSLTAIAERSLVVVATLAMILAQIKPSRKYGYLVVQSEPAPFDGHRRLATAPPLTLSGRPRLVVHHSEMLVLVGDAGARAHSSVPELLQDDR